MTLHDKLTAASHGEGASPALARYMLNALAELPFQSAAEVGRAVGVSEATVGRFCRQMGYANLRALKADLRHDIGDAPWLLRDRLEELRGEDGETALARGLELEIAGLARIYDQARSPDWARSAARLAHARLVHVAGFQTEAGLAQYFAAQLGYLRSGVRPVDTAAGNFADVLLSGEPDACLVIFEARRYSRLARLLAAEAQARAIPVILITDMHCTWDAGLTDATFRIASATGQFWESTAQMAVLGNLLLNSIFRELGPGLRDRMDAIATLYGAVTGHVGGPAPKS